MSIDAVYTERSHLVAALTKLFPSSIEQHVDTEGEVWDDEWRNVCYIDLPTGQVSWHISLADLHLFDHVPRDEGRTWDGHDTAEKYRRVDALESNEQRKARNLAAFLQQPAYGAGDEDVMVD